MGSAPRSPCARERPAGVVLESKGGQPQALSPEDLQRLADGAIPVSGRRGYGRLARQPPYGLTPPATVKRALHELVCVSRRRMVTVLIPGRATRRPHANASTSQAALAHSLGG